MNKTIRTLLARKAEHVAAMRAITEAAATAGRDLTTDEDAQFKALSAKVQAVNASIGREEEIERESQALGVLEVPDTARITGAAPRIAEDPRRGFSSLGEFCRAARSAGGNFSNPGDERLRIGAVAPTTFGNEGAGADGGFAVPPQFSNQIWTLSLTEDSLIPFCDNTPIDSNSMVFPKDETVPWGTDGVRAYWQAEATAATQTKPALGTQTLRMSKLMVLVPMTDELLADTNALNSYIPQKGGDSIRWKTNEAILFGNGNGQPLGAMNAAAAMVVAKDSGQATLTLSDTNLANMKARLPPGSRRRSVWLFNNDVEGALFTLKNSAGYPVYAPFGGGVGAIQQALDGAGADPDDSSPDGQIYGMPMYLSQHANTFTQQGDVMLADLSYYRIITKLGGGVETATSMHLYFDADAMAFRLIFRIDGQPKISKQISPAKGSNKMSPFLQLAAR